MLILLAGIVALFFLKTCLSPFIRRLTLCVFLSATAVSATTLYSTSTFSTGKGACSFQNQPNPVTCPAGYINLPVNEIGAFAKATVDTRGPFIGPKAFVEVHTSCTFLPNCVSFRASASFSVDYLITGGSGSGIVELYWDNVIDPFFTGTIQHSAKGLTPTGQPAFSTDFFSFYTSYFFTYDQPFTLAGSISISCQDCYSAVGRVGVKNMKFYDLDGQPLTLYGDVNLSTTPEPSAFVLSMLGTALLTILLRKSNSRSNTCARCANELKNSKNYPSNLRLF